ncbi:MAG: inosine-5-monophosphate dehydrogenase [Porticoccaceae bacterium]|nr:inosine-5-monophosphate dehydrogenase [Porticoccaceae bacterium]
MKVRDVMHQGAEWRELNTPLVEIAQLMADKDIGAVPIGENDRLVGMVTDRDITCRAVARGLDCSKVTAKDVLSAHIVYCTENEDIDDVLERMENEQVRRVPVINADKRLVGFLSLGDLSHAAPRQVAGEFAAAVSAHH